MGPNFYGFLFAIAVIADFFFFGQIFFYFGEFNNCSWNFSTINLNKVEFILFWTAIIFCSLPIKSKVFQYLSYFIALGFFVFQCFMFYQISDSIKLFADDDSDYNKRVQIDSNCTNSFLMNYIHTIYGCLCFGTYLLFKLIIIASKNSSEGCLKSLKTNHLLYDVCEEDEEVVLYFNFHVHFFIIFFFLLYTLLSLFFLKVINCLIDICCPDLKLNNE